MKKWSTTLLVTALLLSPTTTIASAHADAPVHITVDGKVIALDAQPVLTEQELLVPLRAVAEAVGGQLTWDGGTQSILLSLDGEQVALQVGNPTARVNSRAVALSLAPRNVGGHTLVPLAFLNDALSLQTAWDAASSTVVIRHETQQPLLAKDVARLNMDRVVLIYVYDADGELLGSGSGFVVGADGKVLTNAHVIEGATKAKIVFQDQTEHETNLVLQYDEDRDLALLQFEASDLPTIKFGNSDRLELGEQVVAIGSPIGIQNTVSSGLVSGLNRTTEDMLGGLIEEEDMADLTEEELAEWEKLSNLKFIQTTAPISFGSSGGALFNMQGEVIGVTSNSMSFFSGDLNFAIPSNDVQDFLAKTPVRHTLEELVANDAQSPDDEAAAEEATDPDAMWDALIDLETALNDQYGTYTLPGSEEPATLYFEIWPSDDDTAHDVTLYLDGEADALLTSDGTPDKEKTLALIQELMPSIHKQGGVNPLLTIELSYESDTYDPKLGHEAQTYYPRTGTYQVQRTLAWALLDDETLNVTYQIDPESETADIRSFQIKN
ncbi:MAG TPA: trypsin-like peptidase domain-containing protein [Bacilli bacterium]|nr:trypsin-like peptidase domain-containing protein [Bacilli bacterium]